MEAGKLIRFEDWPNRLAEFMKGAEKRPFSWGEWDCCLLAADCVLALTGTDPASDVRGRYTTRLGAARLIKGDFPGLIRRITATHGMAEINPRLAQRGDVCLVDSPMGEALGICVGAWIACAGPDGLTLLPLKSAICAWRV